MGVKMTGKNDTDYSFTDVVDFKKEIDPLVKAELDTLNQSATNINRLEKELDEARAKYQTTFVEASRQIELLKKKYGSSIKSARPYYELKETAKKTQSEAMQSARKYQTSNSVYMAAKETISLAELRLKDDKAACLSVALQEVFNHALLRVTEAEKERSASEQEHLKHAAAYAEVENKLNALEKKDKRSIAKARSYFNTKKELDVKLQQVKQSLEDLQQAMNESKKQYADALKRLERISNNIHEKRRQQVILMFPREPGVGAEDFRATYEFEQEYPVLPTLVDRDVADYLYNNDDDSAEFFDDCDKDYVSADKLNEFQAKILTVSIDDIETSCVKLKLRKELVGNKTLKSA